MRSLLLVCLVLSCSSPVPTVDAGSAGGAGGSGGGSAGGGSAGGGSAGGGSAGGGSAGGGSGGSGGGAAQTCTQRETAYANAVDVAKRCNPTSLVNPCTLTRPVVVSCGCPTYIEANSAGPVDALQAGYDDAGCVATACPRCALLDAGSCEPVDAGSSEGHCVDVR